MGLIFFIIFKNWKNFLFASFHHCETEYSIVLNLFRFFNSHSQSYCDYILWLTRWFSSFSSNFNLEISSVIESIHCKSMWKENVSSFKSKGPFPMQRGIIIQGGCHKQQCKWTQGWPTIDTWCSDDKTWAVTSLPDEGPPQFGN